MRETWQEMAEENALFVVSRQYTTAKNEEVRFP